MLHNNFPSQKGSYLLVYFLSSVAEISVGRLGKCTFHSGYYVYTGSAKGPGGLNARINHHVKSSPKPHWHIDYFKRFADLVAIGYTTDLDHFECQWAETFKENDNFEIVQAGFGASDCCCKTHFYFTNEPFDFIQTELNIPNFVFLDKNAGNSP